LRTKKLESTADVQAADRVAAYTATRVPAGERGTGLPRPAVPAGRALPEPVREHAPAVDAAGIVVQMRPVEERRRERRTKAALTVSASHLRGDSPVEGTTVDLSRGGMCLRMGRPPGAVHQDVAIADAFGRAVVWVQVLSHRALTGGGFLWHVRVTDADDGWDVLLERTVRRSGRRATERRPTALHMSYDEVSA
jgi:hypothetical protein